MMCIGSCSDDTICGVIALHQLDNHGLATLFNPISSSYYPFANSSAWFVEGFHDCIGVAWGFGIVLGLAGSRLVGWKLIIVSRPG